MSKVMSLLSAVLLGLAGTSVAQSLHVGEQEFDTTDRDVMAGLVERCSTLAADDDNAATAASLTRTAPPPSASRPARSEGADDAAAIPQSPRPIPPPAPPVDRQLLAIGVDGLASSTGEQAPAGEGASAGAPTVESSGSRPPPDLSNVTLQFCREAGVVF